MVDKIYLREIRLNELLIEFDRGWSNFAGGRIYMCSCLCARTCVHLYVCVKSGKEIRKS